MPLRQRIKILVMTVLAIWMATSAQASHISGIRISQTGNTGLMINVDVTAFYTTGSTTSNAYLGTYYNAIPAIDWGDGSTTPRYGYGPSTGIPLVATSTVVNGIPARAYRGSFSHSYGSAGNYTIAANTRCCPLTTPTNTLVTGTLVTTTVTTTGVFGPTTFTTSFVQNTLSVNAVAPGFSKVFSPDTVAAGSPSTLTFTIDNTASTLDDNTLDFTDNLPAGLTVATLPNVVNTCTGGTVTAVTGAASISYTGGEVAAGATCTLSVDVVAAGAGAFTNTTGDLTSAFGNSGTASDTLSAFVPPAFSKSFLPGTIEVTFESVLTFTIDNSMNLFDATALSFTDNLPAGITVSNPAAVVNGCGGMVTAVPNSSVITLAGGSVTAGSTCTLALNIFGSAPGALVNLSGDLTSSLGNSGTATAPIVVTAGIEAAKAFNPLGIGVGEVSTLTIDLDNSFNAVDATGVELTDNLPAGMVVANPANVVNGCNATVTAVPGSGMISLTAGTMAAGTTCSLSVDVEGTAAGEHQNVTSSVTSSVGLGAGASAFLTVWQPATFSKSFAPAAVGVGDVSTLTFTIDNSINVVDAAAISFTDNLPAGMEVASPANVVNGCGGTVAATAGSTTIDLTGGSVLSAGSCSLSVDVTATATGDLQNVSGDLTSSVGNSGSATATLSVNSVPGFTKAFSPEQIQLGGVSTLTFTVDHTDGTAAATNLAFTDNLPAGMEVADPANVVDTCVGGTVTANPGDTTIGYAGGTVAAASTCEISVDVTITSPGEFLNVADPLMSIFGASPAGTAAAALSGGTLLDVPTMSTLGLGMLIGILGLLAVLMIRRKL